MNYFELFSLPESYDIDLNKLEKEYISIQQSAHPDKSSSTKTLEISIKANNAYTILKNPLSRAKYLLSLNKVGIEKEIKNPPMDILQESFIDRENLEKIETTEELEKLLKKTKTQVNNIEKQLLTYFQNQDNKECIIETINLQYKMKFLSEIKNKIKTIR